MLLVEQNARQSLAIADRGYLLENARIVGEGSAAQLKREPAVERAYLGGALPDGGARAGSGVPLQLAASPSNGPDGGDR